MIIVTTHVLLFLFDEKQTYKIKWEVNNIGDQGSAQIYRKPKEPFVNRKSSD